MNKLCFSYTYLKHSLLHYFINNKGLVISTTERKCSTNLRRKFIRTFWTDKQLFPHMNCEMLFETCQPGESLATFGTCQVVFVVHCHVQAQVLGNSVRLWALGAAIRLVIFVTLQMSFVFAQFIKLHSTQITSVNALCSTSATTCVVVYTANTLHRPEEKQPWHILPWSGKPFNRTLSLSFYRLASTVMLRQQQLFQPIVTAPTHNLQISTQCQDIRVVQCNAYSWRSDHHNHQPQ